MNAAPIDFRGEKKLTKENALTDIEQLQTRDDLDQEQETLLVELKEYLS